MAHLYLLHSISSTAADFLVASIWQGLLVAACVAVLLRLLSGLTAAVRSGIWTAVLLLVILFPALSLTLHNSGASASASAGLLHASDAWSLTLLSVWAAFSLLRITQLVASAIRLQRLAARALPVSPTQPVASLLRSSRRRVQLCLSTQVDRPSVAGFFRPRILLSPELLTKLSQRELQQLVLHEMEHLRRYDDWINLVQKLSLALVPLHPVLLWLDRQMCLERERACDDSVLRQTRARKAYATCLTRLAEDSIVRRGFSLALGALGSRERTSELAGRVHRILRAPEKAMSHKGIRFTTAALLIAVVAVAAGLARSPQLVSFASVPAAPARTLATSRLEAAGLQPALSFQPALNLQTASGFRPFMAHPTLVKAIMPDKRSPAIVPAIARKNTRRVRLSRPVLRPSTPMRDPYLTVTAWQPVTAPRLTLTTAQFPQAPQFLYAAVPLRDGWLIIQL